MQNYIAIDIGGTQIRAAVFPETGFMPLRQERIKTVGDGQMPLSRMLELISRIWPENAEVKSIAVASPGFIDAGAGIIISAPNIEGWVNLSLASIIQKKFNVPAHVGNDANLAVLGEQYFGVGQGHKDILYLTISTGIGGGIISGGKLIEGAHGLAAELGHVLADPEGPMCVCGKRGHLEAIASGTAIAGYLVRQIHEGRSSVFTCGENPSARQIAEAARQGDELSIEAYNRAGFYLGRTVADYIAIFNPSLVIFGGGVSLSGDLLLNPLKESLRQNVVSPEYLNDLTITTASLGDDSGLLGALALMKSKSPLAQNSTLATSI